MNGAGKKLWGWYATGEEWVEMGVDADGYLKVDLSAVNFLDLADTPADYTDDALKLVRVNAGEDALEFFTAPYMSDLVDDTTPTLGGNLDPDGKYLTGILQVGEGVTPTGHDVNFYSAIGAGARLFWDESHAALRAGRVTGAQWDNGNVADYSVAMGYNVEASGAYGIALGNASRAQGDNSVAFGYLSTASGEYSTAFGRGTASGQYSSSLGYGTQATHTGAVAIGYGAWAKGNYAISIGGWAYAYGTNSVNIGNQCQARGSADCHVGYAVGHRSVAYNDTILIGKWVEGAAHGASVIGKGVANDNRLINATAYTMMLGVGDTPSIWFGDDTLGFYGTSPIAKQAGVAVTAVAIHAALVNLGLIAA